MDDLDGVIALLGRWHPPALSLAATAAARSRGAAGARASIGRPRPRPPRYARAARGTRKRRDAEAVRHHYDVSNEFFELFLDETMTYSCALFETGTETLEDAQRAKLELICRKLELEPGQRMLDIGCGWGSLRSTPRASTAPRSGESHSPSRRRSWRGSWRARRASATGSSSGCWTTASCARSASTRSPASAWSSTSASAQIDEYARQIARVLAPGGRVLNHGIVAVPPQERGAHIGGEFSKRYVFPDGELLNLSRMMLAFERAGFEALNVENLHTDYAETLRHWTTRFEQHLDEAERLAGTERLRVWRLYLRAARNSFETGQNAVYQLLCSRPLTEGSSSAPTGARHEPARRRVPPERVPA